MKRDANNQKIAYMFFKNFVMFSNQLLLKEEEKTFKIDKHFE